MSNGTSIAGIDNLKSQNESLILEVGRLKKELAETKATSHKYLQNVAHQLSAPINAIKWNIEALENPKVPFHRKQNLLRSVYSQGSLLVRLIKNFSLMSNLEAKHELGDLTEKPEIVDILRLSINLANDFQPQGSEENKKIVVVDDSFREVFKRCEAVAIKSLIGQAISNILENAVKYADPDSVITISAESIKGRKGIAVQSVGIPIDPKEKDRLLLRGVRGDKAKQKIPAGTGIGLYLANKIMEIHKGTIHIEVNGKKSKFTLLF